MKYNYNLWGSKFGECKGTVETQSYLPFFLIDPVPYEEKQPVLTYDHSWNDNGPDVDLNTNTGLGCDKDGFRGAVMVQVPVTTHPHVEPYHKTVNWTIKLPEYEVEIDCRFEDEEFVYDALPDGKLEIYPKASATPRIYGKDIFPWQMDPIQGSEQKLIKVDTKTGELWDTRPVKGPLVLFRYTKLPADNDEFGPKTITADIAEPVTVRVFFEKEEWNSPDSEVLNWFYYWKQGAVPDLDKFKYDWTIDYYGDFDPSTGTLAVGYEAGREKEPRVAGTDARPGIQGEVLKALSKTGDVSAKENIRKIIRGWLQQGPKTDGFYSHIYDSEYFSILRVAIESLRFFPDGESFELLKEIEGDPSLFHSLRESAFETLLEMEMRREEINATEDRVHFLLKKIDAQGVSIE